MLCDRVQNDVLLILVLNKREGERDVERKIEFTPPPLVFYFLKCGKQMTGSFNVSLISIFDGFKREFFILRKV